MRPLRLLFGEEPVGACVDHQPVSLPHTQTHSGDLRQPFLSFSPRCRSRTSVLNSREGLEYLRATRYGFRSLLSFHSKSLCLWSSGPQVSGLRSLVFNSSRLSSRRVRRGYRGRTQHDSSAYARTPYSSLYSRTATSSRIKKEQSAASTEGKGPAPAPGPAPARMTIPHPGTRQ